MNVSKKIIYRVLLIIFLFNYGSLNLANSQTQDTLLVHYNVHLCDSIINANADNPDFVILDVRTAGEYLPDHLIGAINRDYYASNISQLLNALPRNKMYIIHCLAGGRSGIVFNMMYGMNFTWVVDMLGGMNSWKSASFPTTNSFAPMLMAVSDTMVQMDTIAIGSIDTINLTITNRANDTLRINNISSMAGTEFSTDFDTTISLQGAFDYSFSIFYEPTDVATDTFIFVIESNGGNTAFHVTRTGKLLVGIDEKLSTSELYLYPNPASSEFIIEGTETLLSSSVISVFNLSGQEIFSQEIPKNQNVNKIDVSSLMEGSYFVRIMSSSGVVSTKKLLILR